MWSGVPARGLRLRAADATMIPFTLLWCGFAIFWEVQAIRSHAPTGMVVWGVPFVALGLYVLGGRFIVDAMMRTRTVYAVTNRRVLIVRTLFGERVTSLSLDRLPELNAATHRDGTTTITFGPTERRRRAPAPPAFEAIDEGKKVLALLMGDAPPAQYRSSAPRGR